MGLIGWHTEIAGLHDRRKASVPAGHDPRRISCSYSGIHDIPARTGDDVTAEVGQADRYQCREPRGKRFCRLAEISYGPFRFRRFT
jgi:hypothetical protein